MPSPRRAHHSNSSTLSSTLQRHPAAAPIARSKTHISNSSYTWSKNPIASQMYQEKNVKNILPIANLFFRGLSEDSWPAVLKSARKTIKSEFSVGSFWIPPQVLEHVGFSSWCEIHPPGQSNLILSCSPVSNELKRHSLDSTDSCHSNGAWRMLLNILRTPQVPPPSSVTGDKHERAGNQMANRTIGLVLDGNRNGNTEKLAETQVSIVSNDGWPEL